MMKTLPPATSASRLLLAALGALALMSGARADNLSAAAAATALAQGALAWDVRAEPAAAGLPHALRVDAASLDAWLQRGDLAALQAAVSRAGLDLSRDIVVYAEAGDARAQALIDSLQPLARGRLHWLVGGVSEWAMSGRELAATATKPRLPVPQLLVAAAPTTGAMAGAALRATVDPYIDASGLLTVR